MVGFCCCIAWLSSCYRCQGSQNFFNVSQFLIRFELPEIVAKFLIRFPQTRSGRLPTWLETLNRSARVDLDPSFFRPRPQDMHLFRWKGATVWAGLLHPEAALPGARSRLRRDRRHRDTRLRRRLPQTTIRCRYRPLQNPGRQPKMTHSRAPITVSSLFVFQQFLFLLSWAALLMR